MGNMKSDGARIAACLHSHSIALVAAEEFALSMVPLLLAVNEAGGIAASIRILKANKKISGRDPR